MLFLCLILDGIIEFVLLSIAAKRSNFFEKKAIELQLKMLRFTVTQLRYFIQHINNLAAAILEN